MSLVVIAALATAVGILALLAVLQLGVVAGAPWGRFVWGGQFDVLPTRLRIGSAVSIPLYVGFAWVLLGRAGVLTGGAPWMTVAVWVLVGYFGLGVGLNLISRSSAERWTMAPACLVLAGCTLVIALT